MRPCRVPFSGTSLSLHRLSVFSLLLVVAACSKEQGLSPTAPSAVKPSQTQTSEAGAGEATRIRPRASVPPVVVPGNPKCESLGYAFELKVDPNPIGAGPFDYTDGVLSLVMTDASEALFDWSSNIGVDAVIVKAGSEANVYTYDPEATSDTDLVPPSVHAIGHISFCYDIELVVTKTADPTFTRDFDWTIQKSADQTTLSLSPGQQATINYSVVVTKDAGTDSGWTVVGTISVMNPAPIAVSGVTVTDTLSGFGSVAVTCPSTTIAAGATMQCTYGPVSVPDGSARTNTATATTTTTGVSEGTGTAAVTFGTPTTTSDNCVNISDTFAGGPQVTNVCASQTFNYSRTVFANTLGPGAHTLTNTASLATDDGVSETSTANVTVTVNTEPPPPPPPPPPGGQGCTPGYWKNHLDSWAATGFQPNQTLQSVFNVPDTLGLDDNTLLEALEFGGGSGTAGAARVLLRAAVAALLNAAHSDVDYALTTTAIIGDVNAALASGDRGAMLALATQLDAANTAGCTLN